MRLNSIFTDHMVLAADKEIRIFGEGKGSIHISFCGYSVEHQAVSDNWFVTLPAMAAGGPYEMLIDLNQTKITLRDIYIGKVYLFAGQSNVQFKMKNESTFVDEYGDYPTIRSFFLQRLEEGEYYKPSDGWVSCTKNSIPNWSALSYLCAQQLYEKTKCAVGVICCYQGASGILSWLPERTNSLIPYNALCSQYSDPAFSKWNADGTLYYAMFKKIVPYGLSAVIWYQGESDTAETEAAVYDKWLIALVQRWRKDLLDKRLFFAVVQIADYDGEKQNPGWRGIQNAQERAVNGLDFAKLIISKDVCESMDVHPKSKKLLAHRISNVLLAQINRGGSQCDE